MPKSADWRRGYEAALRLAEVADSEGVEAIWDNPFPEGSEAFEGFEAGFYDMTQK